MVILLLHGHIERWWNGTAMGSSYGNPFRFILVFVLLLKEACILRAYVVPLQTSPHVSMSMGTPGRRGGGHKSAAEPMTTRRQALQKLATGALFPAAVLGISVGEASAKGEGGKDGTVEASKQWISGRGAQPKGSDDKTGTRKESKYLRCLSNCLAECQKPTYGPEKDREECLQTCQDECCTSYEQCTYAVTQNK